MKVWEKIYSLVLILFLIIITICSIMVFRMSYVKSVNNIEKVEIAGWRKITIPLSEDFSGSNMSISYKKEKFQKYVSQYYIQDMAFEVWEKKKLILKSYLGSQNIDSLTDEKLLKSEYTNYYDKKTFINHNAYSCYTKIITVKGKKIVVVSGRLGSGDVLVLYRNVSGVLSVWKQLLRSIVILEIISSVIVAVLLYFFIRKILQPVELLSKHAKRIADGDYSEKIAIHSGDELEGLAENLNTMSGDVDVAIKDKNEELQRKQEFINALSHELRTPLTSIKGYAQLCETAKLTEEKMAEYLGYISKESTRMMGMTDTMRNAILLGKDDVYKEMVSVERILKDLSGYTKSIELNPEIHVEYKVMNKTIFCDRELTEMLLVNLIKNAVLACREQGNIIVSFEEKVLSVVDNGVGMSKECAERICEPFYREDKARSRKAGGTGLGMFICKKIVERQGWKMEIQSEKGVGTKILLYIS